MDSKRGIKAVRQVLSVALAISLAIPHAAFAATGEPPATAPIRIASEDFEAPTGPYIVDPTLDLLSPQLWGRLSGVARTGSWSMWAAGTNGFWPSYAPYTNTKLVFSLPQLSDYYASTLQYYYSLPSVGSVYDQFWEYFERIPSSGPIDPEPRAVTGLGVWSPRMVDLTLGGNSLSRYPGLVAFRFMDQNNDYGLVGHGPLIDDVAVTGWKYGAPRSFSASLSTGAANLSWARPYRSTAGTSTEERSIHYRVYRAPGNTSSWEEITQSSSAATSVTVTTPIAGEGRSYRYAVQAWDASPTPGYGMLSEPATITVPNVAPTISLTSPSAGFPILASSPVAVQGTAADSGSGIKQVDVRIRRSDGVSWNGVTWAAGDQWLPASGTTAWSASWQPDIATLASGLSVSITARATDNALNQTLSPSVLSRTPLAASVSLASGDNHTTTSTVSAAISAPDATHMRWRVNSGTWSTWSVRAASILVPLGSTDGTKTVDFEFSTDGGATVAGAATDSILLHTSVPQAAIAGPVDGFVLKAGEPVVISGTSSDPGGSIASVEVRIARTDGRTWNGTQWGLGETWLPASTANGYASWSTSFTPDPVIMSSGQAVTVSARTTDAYGLVGVAAPVTSAVPVALSVVLAGGAAETTASIVTASVSATGSPSYLRWRVDGGTWSGWTPFAAQVLVPLAPPDGTKTVTVEASRDGLTAVAAASDTISLHTSVPSVSIVSPASGFMLADETATVSGIASDAGGSISAVTVRIRRDDGMCWNGSSWTGQDVWLSAQTVNGYSSWSLPFRLDTQTLMLGNAVAVTARAADAHGLSATSTTVRSAVPVAASVMLGSGASFTTTRVVSASVTATGTVNWMRARGDVVGAGTWSPFSEEGVLTLASGDGTKTVAFDFADVSTSTVSATATDTILLHTSVPTVGVTAPSAGFLLSSLPVAISGNAADSGGTVSGVEVLIRRSDGKSWMNGVGWVAGDAWAAASTTSAYATWSHVWSPLAADIEAPKIVSIVARATDSYGLSGSSAAVNSAVPVGATAISLASGAASTSSRMAPVSVDGGVGATHMRWKVGSGSFGPWQVFSAGATVDLGSTEGTKTVTFEFSSDGSSVAASATDDIVLHTSVPTASVMSPAAGFALRSGTTTLVVNASDTAAITSVAFLLQRSDGACWTGSAWNAGSPVWLAGTYTGGGAWSYPWTLSPGEIAAGRIVSVSARATDAFGLVGLAAPVSSSVPIIASVMLDDGASHTADTSVTVGVSAGSGATHMRIAVDGLSQGWVPVAASTDVTVTSTEGTKTIVVDLSADGGSSIGASASRTIVLDKTGPVITPALADGFDAREPATVTVGAVDAGAGAASVRIRVQHQGLYWNGEAWDTAPFDNIASADGAAWSWKWAPGSPLDSSYDPVIFTIIAADSIGNVSERTVVSADPKRPTALAVTTSPAVVAYGAAVTISADFSSLGTPLNGPIKLEYATLGQPWRVLQQVSATGGRVSFLTRPTEKTSYRVTYAGDAQYSSCVSANSVTMNTRALLDVPRTPSIATRYRRFTVYGNLRPAHRATARSAVRLQVYQYYRRRWVLRKTVYAPLTSASGYVRYQTSLSLGSGTWKVRALHADANHYSTVTAFRTFRVR